MDQTFNATGHNARNNINSIDNSTNVVHHAGPFGELRTAIEGGVTGDTEKTFLLEMLAELEAAKDQKSASERFQAFVSAAADYMTIVGPFLPALGHWVHNMASTLG